MHELIKGLQGVEVVADDFIIVGKGKTMDETVKDHDKCVVCAFVYTYIVS